MIIAVVVPCRNEVTNIEECIRAIYNSKIPLDWQLIVSVVDGKSNDGTIEKIEVLRNDFSNLEIIANEKQLTPFAFNLGIKSIHADFYQIIGARQIIDPNYLRIAVERIQNQPEIWCVGGAVENVYLNDTGKIIASAMSTSLGMGLGNFRTKVNSGYVDTVGTPMYPRSVFEKIGFFDEELIRNQDDDFNFRVTQAGGKIFYDADISLKYYVRGNFKGLRKQFFQYGYWKVYVNRKHKSITTIRQLVPPLFVLFLIIFPFTLIVSKVLFFIAFAFFGLYFVLCLVVSFKLKGTDKSLNFFDLFKTFPILHISYGLGFLRGMMDFLILRKGPSMKQTELSR